MSYEVPAFKSYCTCGGPHYKVPIFHKRYGGPFRVIDSYKVPAFHIRYGGTMRVINSYKVPIFHIRYGDHQLGIDSYKVSSIVHVGYGGPCYKVP